MRHRIGIFVVALTCAVLIGPYVARPAVGAPAVKASITFDVATGRVYQAHNVHDRLRVASTFKLMTALVVRSNVPIDAKVVVSERAARVPPLKLTMRPGSRWRANDLLHAMLIASLNDAATALAIRAGGGSLEGFHRAAVAEGRRLGLTDDPRMLDPAGLDGDESVGGGNLISARDLAIVTRAFLADPLLAGIVRLPSYSFDGGDGEPHIVYNHNAFMNIYPGAIGVKTGYTEKSGHSLVAAATRDGRTIATVVIGSPDPVGYATQTLDAAFAGPPNPPGDQDVLPPLGIAPAALGDATTTRRPTSFTARVQPTEPSPTVLWGGVVLIAVVGAGVLSSMRVRVLRRTRTRARPEP